MIKNTLTILFIIILNFNLISCNELKKKEKVVDCIHFEEKECLENKDTCYLSKVNSCCEKDFFMCLPIPNKYCSPQEIDTVQIIMDQKKSIGNVVAGAQNGIDDLKLIAGSSVLENNHEWCLIKKKSALKFNSMCVPEITDDLQYFKPNKYKCKFSKCPKGFKCLDESLNKKCEALNNQCCSFESKCIPTKDADPIDRPITKTPKGDLRDIIYDNLNPSSIEVEVQNDSKQKSHDNKHQHKNHKDHKDHKHKDHKDDTKHKNNDHKHLSSSSTKSKTSPATVKPHDKQKELKKHHKDTVQVENQKVFESITIDKQVQKPQQEQENQQVQELQQEVKQQEDDEQIKTTRYTIEPSTSFQSKRLLEFADEQNLDETEDIEETEDTEETKDTEDSEENQTSLEIENSLGNEISIESPPSPSPSLPLVNDNKNKLVENENEIIKVNDEGQDDKKKKSNKKGGKGKKKNKNDDKDKKKKKDKKKGKNGKDKKKPATKKPIPTKKPKTTKPIPTKKPKPTKEPVTKKPMPTSTPTNSPTNPPVSVEPPTPPPKNTFKPSPTQPITPSPTATQTPSPTPTQTQTQIPVEDLCKKAICPVGSKCLVYGKQAYCKLDKPPTGSPNPVSKKVASFNAISQLKNSKFLQTTEIKKTTPTLSCSNILCSTGQVCSEGNPPTCTQAPSKRPSSFVVDSCDDCPSETFRCEPNENGAGVTCDIDNITCGLIFCGENKFCLDNIVSKSPQCFDKINCQSITPPTGYKCIKDDQRGGVFVRKY